MTIAFTNRIENRLDGWIFRNGEKDLFVDSKRETSLESQCVLIRDRHMDFVFYRRTRWGFRCRLVCIVQSETLRQFKAHHIVLNPGRRKEDGINARAAGQHRGFPVLKISRLEK